MNTLTTSSQVVSLRDLLSSTLVATVDADTAAARRYFTNMCELAFEYYDKKTDEAGDFRTLTLRYTGADGTPHSLDIPILSLVPLPLLQVKEADFGFNIRIADLSESQEEAFFILNDSSDPTKSEFHIQPQLRVALRPFRSGERTNEECANAYMPNMKVNVKLQQSDLPGGLSRFLQIVNNMEYKTVENNKAENDAKHE